MADAEKVIRQIAGNVGSDPTFRTGEYGEWVTFSVAVTRSYPDRDKGEQYGETRWYSVGVSKPALVEEVRARIRKGSKVVAEGVPSVVEKEGQSFYNFKAFRVGVVDYLGTNSVPFDPEGGAVIEEDDDL